MKNSAWILVLAGWLVSAGCNTTDGGGTPGGHPGRCGKDMGAPAGQSCPMMMGRAMDPQRREVLAEREDREAELALQAKEDEQDFQNEMRKLDLEKKRKEVNAPGPREGCPMQKGHHGRRGPMACALHGVFIAGCLLMHVLLTVWVYRDIRQRNAGSGIWVVITLLSGFLGALLYALVRIGERPPER